VLSFDWPLVEIALVAILVALAGILQMNPELVWILALLPRFDKTPWRYGRLAAILAPRTAAGGLIWPSLLASGRTPPVGCPERMTIEHLMPVQAAAAAGVRQ
jgi:hypothetical protein